MNEGKPTFIPIREGVPQLEHPPTLAAVPLLKSLTMKVVATWLRPRHAARQKKTQLNLEKILAVAGHCRTRDELEAVLGHPAYSLSGRDFASNRRHPDHVEVYLVSGCTVEVLFFLAERRIEFFGFRTPKATDFVLGLVDDRH